MASDKVGRGSIRPMAALQEQRVSRHLCGSEGTGSDNGLGCSRRSGAGALSKPWRRNLILHVADSGMKVNKTATDLHRRIQFCKRPERKTWIAAVTKAICLALLFWCSTGAGRWAVLRFVPVPVIKFAIEAGGSGASEFGLAGDFRCRCKSLGAVSARRLISDER